MKRSLLLILLSLCTIGIVAFFLASKKQTPGPVAKETPLAFEPQRWTLPDPGRTDSQSYKEMVARLEAQRVALAARYQQTASSAQQAEIMAQARTLVSRSIYTEIFPSWYGTVWDFNGTTEVPQQGKIACGYFVTTVLRDAGWKVQRARLAQQASENIILSLTTDAYIKRFRRVAISDFVNAVKEWGAGIYVVGLDIHTGCTKARFRRAYPDDWPVRGREVGFFSVQISSARSIGVSEFPVRKRLPA
ncbi:MAG TPA: hypothetical protein VJM50_08150, partial [Pyrinomonadaceae bacterium]|nr:hypothetical protein [Pyrinomonadaceae bacterium]